MAASPRSSTSFDSFSSGRESPIHGFDSSAALILVTDSDGTPNSASFDFSSDDEAEGDSDQLERLRSSSIPPLSSISVFLYLLAPFLKLGALLVPDGGLPLKISIPALVFFAALSAFSRQIWYMLARYVRRAELEEIVLETFARGRGKETRRWALRHVVRIAIGIMRVMLAALYMRAAVDVLLPLIPQTLLLSSHITVAVLLAIAVSPIYFASSLGARSVIYASWASIAAYAAWFAFTTYMHAKGMLVTSAGSASLGILWQGISTIVFTFTTASTIPLYSSLKGALQPGNASPKRSQSFKLLSTLSVGFALLLILPLAFFQSSPSPPSIPTRTPKVFAAFFNAGALTLSIPSILITCPSLPSRVSIRRATNFPLSKSLLYLLTLCLSVLPTSWVKVLSDVLLVLAFISTYLVPAFIHITIHNFRRPLSIIVPPNTPATSSSQAQLEASESRNDELLQRKERTLQRRRLGRRLVWDVGVWMLLVPVGGGGLVWAGGRVAGRW
ncbi:hypothetical protein A0H81_11193 [Grifola frondosa]|uniref:Amino acid transporter transmembrane domain-containing protein n=1 Tax=Grifola frondosa TaxID=5627 RepID=A0A1C7LXG1_GRIFR|nr:hypothetical protein A0H81_11193 [Grifola frondosa]